MVLQSPKPDTVIPNISLAEYTLEKIQQYGDAVALIEEGDCGKEYTYRQLYDNMVKCASALNKLGVKKGEVVATCCGNCAAYPVIFIATASCGAILTTCNPVYTHDEILKQFIQSEPKVVFVNAENFETVKKVSATVKSIKFIFSVDECDYCTSIDELIGKANIEDFPRNVQISPDDVVLLPYSSGTTGLPKGVMLTHRNVIAAQVIQSAVLSFSRLDVVYFIVPMFHIYGASGIVFCLSQGVKFITEPRFDLFSMLEKIQKYKITTFTGVPPILVAMDKMPLAEQYDLTSLRHVGCGAAPLPDGVSDSVAKKYNFTIGQGWGLTECIPGTSSLTDNTPTKSVGSVVCNTLLKVIDTQTGLELEANKSGELLLKGPQVMKGYYKNQRATAECIDRDGWLHTGDVGYYDDMGFVYVIDRIKELIKVKGFQVAPAELEELLLRNNKVADVGVIGVPHPQSGEAPKAYIVKNDDSLSEREIHEFMKDKVSKFKYLTGGITFLDAIPKTQSGKILRRDLRQIDLKDRSPKM